MTIGAIVALDIATTTGWAWHKRDLPRPLWGSERLPGGPHAVGQPADRLERLLRQLYIMLKPHGGISHFFFEAQHLAKHGNVDVIYRLIALGGIVEKFAFQTGAHCYKVDISTWRKHFIGRGSGFKRDQSYPGKTKPYLPGEDPKILANDRCRALGWHTDVFDESDALGILDFSLTLIGNADPTYTRPWRDNALMGGMI